MAVAPRSERPDMEGYGVTDDPEGMLPWAWAEERLLGSRNFWFVTVRPSGRPHAMPLWGVWMPERQRWGFGCSPTAHKVANLAANDQVVVTTDDTIEVVSVEGTAVAIDGDEAEPLVHAWAEKYEPHMGETTIDEARAFMRDSSLFEVVPHRAFGLIERPEEFSTAATRWVWT